MPSFLPNIPPAILNLIQTNSLSRIVRESLGVSAAYMLDATDSKMPEGVGGELLMTRLGRMDADLRPSPALGAPTRGTFATEQFKASPQPYRKAFDIDAPSAYAQTVGSKLVQSIERLGDWAGRTSSRLARGRLFTYCGGQSIVRRAQTTSDSVLLVNSLAGFRFAYVNGRPEPVSSVNSLPVTIVAATTFTASVTGVTPLDPDFPDGPGQLTLSTALSANVAAQSYVYVTDARPKIVRPNDKASTEALVAGDIPKLEHVIAMKARLRGRGVLPHMDGTYHLHVDEWFFALVIKDTAWTQAFSTAGISPLVGANAVWSPSLGITIIENNDSPTLGKGIVKAVGSADATVGATGTPGSSLTMQDNGLDVVSSTGVQIRRAIMTGRDVMDNVWVDESRYIELMGGQTIHKISNDFDVVNIGGTNFVNGRVGTWRLLIRPPLDEAALITTITVSSTFDLVLGTDRDAISDISDKSPLKRAVVLEYGSPAY